MQDIRPHLLWVVRDMELELVDAAGSAITPTQWLKSALRDADAVGFGSCPANSSDCSQMSLSKQIWCVTPGSMLVVSRLCALGFSWCLPDQCAPHTHLFGSSAVSDVHTSTLMYPFLRKHSQSDVDPLFDAGWGGGPFEAHPSATRGGPWSSHGPLRDTLH